jgi:hypothetical protein
MALEPMQEQFRHETARGDVVTRYRGDRWRIPFRQRQVVTRGNGEIDPGPRLIMARRHPIRS